MNDTLAGLDWNRLAAGDRRALDEQHQWAFDRLAKLDYLMLDCETKQRRIEELEKIINEFAAAMGAGALP